METFVQQNWMSAQSRRTIMSNWATMETLKALNLVRCTLITDGIVCNEPFQIEEGSNPPHFQCPKCNGSGEHYYECCASI